MQKKPATFRKHTSFRNFSLISGIFLNLWLAKATCEGKGWIPFTLPWNDSSHSETDVSFLLRAPAGKEGPVRVKEGRFYQGGRRIRFWGVNFCFGACFPKPELSPVIASRLAKFGINCVRFHHMDSAPFPRGIFADRRLERLSKEALARFDRFVWELKKRGIYCDINLHVSRWWSRAHAWPGWRSLRNYDKMVDLFYPELIEAQRRYARDLLTHKNPFTGKRYTEESAVAMVEITNEDSLLMWGALSFLPRIPKPYAEVLKSKWNEYLRRKYKKSERLRSAWSPGTEPLGEELIKDPRFETLKKGDSRKLWRVEEHRGSRMSLVPADDGVFVRISKTTGTDWHLKLKYPGIQLTKARAYSVSFKAKAEGKKSIRVAVSQEGSPWKNLGLSKQIQLGPELAEFKLFFRATADEENARLEFCLGRDDRAVFLSSVSLRPGGVLALGPGESLERGSVELFPKSFAPTQARLRDRVRFLSALEAEYFLGMKRYLKEELGLLAPVTGTIAFGALGTRIQAQMDYVDQHAYWQHPRFPRRPWDPRDWLIRNVPMSSDKGGGTFERLAATRVAGKPYTVSEYNHPAPLDSQAETVPMISSFGAWQDWDGVFIFTYNNSDNFEKDCFRGFFDIDVNPSKMGFMPAGALIFLGGNLRPAPSHQTVFLSEDQCIEAALDSPNQLVPYLKRGGFSWKKLLGRRWAVAFERSAKLQDLPKGKDFLKWDPGAGVYVAGGERCAVFCGSLGGKRLRCGPVILEVRAPSSCSVVLASRDRLPLSESKEILLVGCGRCENTGMVWSADRSSVGNKWGKGPVKIEPVLARVRIETRHSQAWFFPLDERGKKLGKSAIPAENGAISFEIGAGKPSLWYLLEAK